MALNLGLSISDVVNVSVVLQPNAAQARNFGSLLILGDSGVIDVLTRYRLYTSLTGVAADFGTTTPEYLAATIAFGQNPSLSQLYIGAWARTATNALLIGGTLSATQQAIANFTAVTSGSMNVTINGSVVTLLNMNFTGQTNLNGVASVITSALGGAGTVVWNANLSQFQLASITAGATSTVSFATAGAQTDVSTLTGLNANFSGSYIVNGIGAETPLACATTFMGLSNSWYGLTFAASTMPQDSDYVAVAGAIQSTSGSVSRIFGVTTQEAASLNAALNSDIGSQLQALGYNRTFVQYSSSSPYAAVGIFGDAFTCNFNGSNTLYTLKFLTETGVVAETLTETQAAALTGKNVNVYVNYNNSTAILQQGTMANGTFFDVIHGTDWLQNFIQTNVYNVLITSQKKVPQTDAGVTSIVNAVVSSCQQGVINALIAPGVWLGPPIGAIVTGQTLSKGFYIFAPPIATQTLAQRQGRQSPLIQACIKLAGAIHFANVVLTVSY